ncbi:unnamed protein product [Camellia sinensis]
MEKRIAVVTGGNKGIGLEICRQLASNGIMVILTARDEKRGLEVVENLKACGLSGILFHQLEVTDHASITSMADFIKNKFGKLDILVNNAGISGSIIDEDAQKRLKLVDIVSSNLKAEKFIEQSYEMGEACLGTNYYGVKLVTEELIPLLQLSDSAKIVNVSSTLGQLELVLNEKAKKELSDADSLTKEKVEEVLKRYLEDLKEDLLETKGWPVNISAYIMSKAALNAYTRVLAKKYPNIAINAVSPGFVKTDLNHHRGILTVEQGAKGPVMLALLPNGGPSGLFYDQMEAKRIAVVTGANKGIGLEICRLLASNGITVILTARDEKRSLEAVENLKTCGLSNIIFHQLGVTDQTSIASLADFIKTKFNKLDILEFLESQLMICYFISNEKAKKELNDIDGLTLEKVDDVIGRFLEDLKEDLLETKGWPIRVSAYKVSKAALNAYTRVLAKKYRNIVINAVSPGHVKTDINQNTGTLTVEHGAKWPVRLALLPHGGPSGLFYDQMENIANERAKMVLSKGDEHAEEKVEEVVNRFLKDVKEDMLETKGWPINLSAYVVSKAALNAYSRILATKFPNFQVNCVSPGFVKTNMNCNNGEFDVEEGAKGPIALALTPADGPSGLVFDQMEISSF